MPSPQPLPSRILRSLLTVIAILGTSVARANDNPPAFSFRGWETQVDGLWLQGQDGRQKWYRSDRYLKYLHDIINRAPTYQVNALILMGRGNNAEPSSFITYRQWPRLYELYRNRKQEERLLQIQKLNDLTTRARDSGIGIWLWAHELQWPEELQVLYPELSAEAPGQSTAPNFWTFIESKYEELLDVVPGISGVFLVLNETQFSLLHEASLPFKTRTQITAEDHLRQLILTVHNVLNRRGKRLIVRTFGTSLKDIELIARVIETLPDGITVDVMSKATACDFFGFRYPDNPAFDRLTGQSRILEETVGEFRGKTHIVCTPTDFYATRIRRAARRGLTGVVVRVDHNGYPKSNFESANLLNLHLISKLWIDPNDNVPVIVRNWLSDRYSPKASEQLAKAFGRTENIWEQATNTLGHYSVSAHGNLPPLYQGAYCAWDNLNASVRRIAGITDQKYDHAATSLSAKETTWRADGRELLRPNFTTLERIHEEVTEANHQARSALEEVTSVADYLTASDRNTLLREFRVLEHATRLFGHLKRTFFLGLQAGQDPLRRPELLRRALGTTREAIEAGYEIERRFGGNHWPVQPDDQRGASLYQILTDAWSGHLFELTLSSQKSFPDGGWDYQLGPHRPVGRLWKALIEAGRPDASTLASLQVQLEHSVKFTKDGQHMMVTVNDAPSIAWPLVTPVQGPELKAARNYHITLEVTSGSPIQLSVQRERPVDSRILPEPDLNQSLMEHQLRQLKQDQAVREKINSIETLKAYQNKVRSNWLEILGPWPEKTPLKPVKVGQLERAGYRIEKILLQSQPGFYIPVNLYVPDGEDGPFPTVLSPIGHAPNGKTHDTRDNYQTRFITLAKKGYVVCTWDPLGQGEREPYGAQTGNHHSVQGFQCMPSGRHFCMYFIWDGIRCLDYLETRPEVDQKQIACAGCSGGGALTQYLSAIDERITLAVPTSWIAESTLLTVDPGLHTESWFPGMCDPYGPGTRQLLACIAPRPLLILGNQHDSEFPPESMKRVADDTYSLYKRLGIEARFQYTSVPTQHGFWPEARRELYRFLNHHFQQEQQNDLEPAVTTEPIESLQCAPGGQVRHLPGSRTVFDLNREIMTTLADQRETRRNTLSDAAYIKFIHNAILHSAQIKSPFPSPVMHPVENLSAKTSRYLLEYLPKFHTYATLYRSESTRRLIVIISDNNTAGKNWAMELQLSGWQVLHIESDKTDHRREIMSGSPRPGRWAHMLISGTSAISPYLLKQPESIILFGEGQTASLAVPFAAIAAPKAFTHVITLGGLDQINSLSSHYGETHPLQMLPGALRGFDESDVVSALAPRPALIGDVHNRENVPLTSSEINERFEWAIRRYQTLSHTPNLRLMSGPVSTAAIDTWLISLHGNP
ncbi:MAG: alpha/beta hydrolase family protein [Planctomycetota bacterium]|nr:alpha/beta hydrolase family protein [Planctomycetota bacterium]